MTKAYWFDRAKAAEARLVKAENFAAAAEDSLKEAFSLPPEDCTGDGGYGPCNCSGIYRWPPLTQALVDALEDWKQSP